MARIVGLCCVLAFVLIALTACTSRPPRAALPAACTTSESRVVLVLGNVASPGQQQVVASESVTLTRAIDRAGGLTPIAWGTHIRVVRQGCDGRRFAVVFNVDAIREGSSPDPVLAPGDVVFVGERNV